MYNNSHQRKVLAFPVYKEVTYATSPLRLSPSQSKSENEGTADTIRSSALNESLDSPEVIFKSSFDFQSSTQPKLSFISNQYVYRPKKGKGRPRKNRDQDKLVNDYFDAQKDIAKIAKTSADDIQMMYNIVNVNSLLFREYINSFDQSDQPQSLAELLDEFKIEKDPQAKLMEEFNQYMQNSGVGSYLTELKTQRQQSLDGFIQLLRNKESGMTQAYMNGLFEQLQSSQNLSSDQFVAILAIALTNLTNTDLQTLSLQLIMKLNSFEHKPDDRQPSKPPVVLQILSFQPDLLAVFLGVLISDQYHISEQIEQTRQVFVDLLNYQMNHRPEKDTTILTTILTHLQLESSKLMCSEVVGIIFSMLKEANGSEQEELNEADYMCLELLTQYSESHAVDLVPLLTSELNPKIMKSLTLKQYLHRHPQILYFLSQALEQLPPLPQKQEVHPQFKSLLIKIRQVFTSSSQGIQYLPNEWLATWTYFMTLHMPLIRAIINDDFGFELIRTYIELLSFLVTSSAFSQIELSLNMLQQLRKENPQDYQQALALSSVQAALNQVITHSENQVQWKQVFGFSVGEIIQAQPKKIVKSRSKANKRRRIH